ncbi:AzlD domain-containing protein [Paraglaciecola sp.]|uniref:AzlD domain-containing protein n=1 Tax=Paraglaciecola sp. TaxID=1920173 RepID=UPI003EF0C3DD
MDNFWLILTGMSAITFSCRYFFFSKKVPFELGPKSNRLLSYTAPSVLTAMWAPIVFMGHQGTHYQLFESPFLIAGLGTIALSLKIKSALVIVTLGMAGFVILRVL